MSCDEFYRPVIRRILRLTVAGDGLVRRSVRCLAKIGLLTPSVWRRLPVEGAFRVAAHDGKGFTYESVPNDLIGRALFWSGLTHWEKETTAVFWQLAKQASCVLDVGANTGVYTLLACAASDTSRVVSFEPVPRVYQRLLRNVELNSWVDRCELRNEACSDHDGFARFHVPYDDVPTSASLNPMGFRGYSGELVDIPVTTVDAVCSGTGRVDVVKIDVEGYEDRVLYGMVATLARSMPTIIVECNPDCPYSAVEALLSDFGYHFYHLRPEGPVLTQRIVPDVKRMYCNYLCTVDRNLPVL